MINAGEKTDRKWNSDLPLEESKLVQWLSTGNNISSNVTANEMIFISFTELKKFNPVIKFNYKVLNNTLQIRFNKILTAEETSIAKKDLSSIKSDLIEATNILDITYKDNITTIVLQII